MQRHLLLFASFLLLFLLVLGGIGYVLYELGVGQVARNADGTIVEPWLKRTHQTIHETDPHSPYGARASTEYWVYEYFPENLPAPGRETRAALRGGKILKNSSHYDEYYFGLATCLAKAKRIKDMEKAWPRIKDEPRRDQCLGTCARFLAQDGEIEAASTLIDSMETGRLRSMAIVEVFQEALKLDSSSDAMLLELANKHSSESTLAVEIESALLADRIDLGLKLFRQFSPDNLKPTGTDEAQMANMLVRDARQGAYRKILDTLVEHHKFDGARTFLDEFREERKADQGGQLRPATEEDFYRTLVTIAIAEVESGDWQSAVASVRDIPDGFRPDPIESLIVPMVDAGLIREATAAALERTKEKRNPRFFEPLLDRLLELDKIAEAVEVVRELPDEYSTDIYRPALIAMTKAGFIDDAVSLAKDRLDYTAIVVCLMEQDMLERAVDVADGVSPLSKDSCRGILFRHIIVKLMESGPGGLSKARQIVWRCPVNWNDVLEQLPTDRYERAETRQNMSNLLSTTWMLLNDVAQRSGEPVTLEEYRKLAVLGVPHQEIGYALLKAGDRENADLWAKNHLLYYEKNPIDTGFIASLIHDGFKEEAVRLARKENDKFLLEEVARSLTTCGDLESAVEFADSIPVVTTDPKTGNPKADVGLRTRLFEAIRARMDYSTPEGYSKIREVILQYPLSWQTILENESLDEETVRAKCDEIADLRKEMRRMHQETFRQLSGNVRVSKQPLTSAEYEKLAAFGLPNSELLRMMIADGETESAKEMAENAKRYYGNSEMLEILDESLVPAQ